MKLRLKKVCAVAMSAVLCTGLLSFGSLKVETYAAAGTPAVTEIPNTNRTQKDAIDGSFLSVTGFAKGHVNDRSTLKEGDEQYAVVTNEEEFFEALNGAAGERIQVIEIRSDLYLGWNELSEDVREEYDRFVEAYEKSESLEGAPLANPSMIESGVSQITINGVKGLTIFSKTGNKLCHGEIKINADVDDLVIRNLEFADVWDWDDQRTSGYGATGVLGTSKRTGWAYIKVNGAKNVWIDHCTFGVAFDGLIDVENGASGVSITWCDFGDLDYSPGSMLYKAIDLLENQYQKNKKDSSVGVFKIYKLLRDGGMSTEDVAKYMGYHKKVHLGGGGDTDSWWFSEIGENLLEAPEKSRANANEYLRLTLAYNNYENMGSRLPLIRGGVGHLYNCYFDNTGIAEASELITKRVNGNSSIQEKANEYKWGIHLLSRGMNPRNGASIAADTCVYYNFETPILGAEHDAEEYLNDSNKSNDVYANLFGYNHALIVNSTVRQYDGDTHTGSSWDNNGDNIFNDNRYWKDKSTINNWSWGQEGEQLSYDYQTFPLEDVETNVKKYSGAYTMDMSADEWLKVNYADTQALKVVDKSVEVPIETISLSKTEAVLFMEEEFLQLDARVTPSYTTVKPSVFTWTSSDESVATVSNSGLVLPLKSGTTTITVKTPNGLEASCEVVVSEMYKKLTISDVPDKIYVGDIIDLGVEMNPDPDKVYDDTVIWESAGFRLQVLDGEKGIFKALSAGANPVQVTSAITGNRPGSTATSGRKTITIEEADVLVKGVEVPEQIEVRPGNTKKLNASVIPANATSNRLLYDISDCSVAAVSADGTVIGIATGETVITVTSVNGGYSKSCVVKVFADAKDDDLIPSGPAVDPEDPSGTPVDPEDPSGTPVDPEDPSGTPVDPEDPSGTPVDPEDPSGTPVKPEDPSGTPVDPEDPSGTPVDPEEPSGTPVKPEEPSGTPVEPENPTGAAVSPGDVDGDGEIKLNDAQLALRAALLLVQLDQKGTQAADVNEDGQVKLDDAQQILRKALLLIETFDKVSPKA